MDAVALGLLWLVVLVPVAFSAARRRRDSITEFGRALESLQPVDWLVGDSATARASVSTVVRAQPPAHQTRRRRVAHVLTVLVMVAGAVAVLSRTRASIGAGVLVADLCIAYAAAAVAADRGLLASARR